MNQIISLPALSGLFRRASASGRLCAFLLPLFFLLGGAAWAKEGLPPAPKIIWQGKEITVTALQDRPTEMALSLFSGPATPKEREKYFKDGKTPASINAFLIRTRDKNILVDTGYGTARPGRSGLISQLAQIGVEPSDVDEVLLTHMHPDHVAGLLEENGRAFSKAVIRVSQPELAYWLGLAEKEPENKNAALVKNVVEAYDKDLLPPFAFGEEVLPGVTALDAVGHTPGHTVFLVRSGDKSLLLLGDLIHAAALQFPLPDECAEYDGDHPAAVKARRSILNMAAKKDLPVAGMHIPFPGMGSVKKEGVGFRFTSIQ